MRKAVRELRVDSISRQLWTATEIRVKAGEYQLILLKDRDCAQLGWCVSAARWSVNFIFEDPLRQAASRRNLHQIDWMVAVLADWISDVRDVWNAVVE